MSNDTKYAPGMRIIVRGEEWIVKRVETNSLVNQTLQVSSCEDMNTQMLDND